MDSRLIGCILIVVGTTIGAGVLALPIITAHLGFLGALILLTACWAVMLAASYVFLEANLWMPPNSNLISMSKNTLGRTGEVIAWIFNLVFLYSILCAYISGGGDLVSYVTTSVTPIHLPMGLAAVLFASILGFVVLYGVRAIDYMNRFLMTFKMGSLLILILLLLGSISISQLMKINLKELFTVSNWTITIVAFGSVIVVPSLRVYLNNDVRRIKLAIFWGTLIPLICYVLWDMVIMGVIPYENGLDKIHLASNPNSLLIQTLTGITKNSTITAFGRFFPSICMATSFLSISLTLSDFIADGLGVRKSGKDAILVYSLTFLPPVLAVLFFPNLFLKGLHFAGLCCLFLMLLFPALMVLMGRKKYVEKSQYTTPGGSILLWVIFVFSVLLIGQELFNILTK